MKLKATPDVSFDAPTELIGGSKWEYMTVFHGQINIQLSCL